MTASDDGLQGGLLGHLQQAVVHGLGALRCYVGLLAADVERRGRRLLDQAMWALLLAGVGIAGVVLFASGAARWIESRLETPGSGEMIIGLGLIVAFLAAVLARALRKERRP